MKARIKRLFVGKQIGTEMNYMKEVQNGLGESDRL